jgi:hypothetical protein
VDGERFDRLTRALAGGASRRRILGILLGAVPALGARRPAAADRPRLGGESCFRHDQCVSAHCIAEIIGENRVGFCDCDAPKGRDRCANPDLVCNIHTGRCVPPGSLGLGGEPCQRNSECMSQCDGRENVCNCGGRLNTPCADPGHICRWDDLCRPPGIGDEVCLDDHECRTGLCLRDRHDRNNCSCSTGPDGVGCVEGLRCVGNRCEAKLIGGAPCAGDGDCQAGRCLSSGVCACSTGPRPVGCVEPTNPCHQSLVCEDDVCRPRDKPDGAACPSDGNPCHDHVCRNGQCTHPNKSDGAACPSDGNPCHDHACRNGQCTHPNKPDNTQCSRPGTGLCLGGTCRCVSREHQLCPENGQCRFPLGHTCSRDNQCCDTAACCDGVCTPKSRRGTCPRDACAELNDACDVSEQCCDGNRCCNGRCRLNRGSRCDTDEDCCDDASLCNGGQDSGPECHHRIPGKPKTCRCRTCNEFNESCLVGECCPGTRCCNDQCRLPRGARCDKDEDCCQNASECNGGGQVCDDFPVPGKEKTCRCQFPVN